MSDNREQAFYRLWGNVHRPERGCWTPRTRAPGVKGGYHQVQIGYHPVTGNAVTKVASRFVYEVLNGGPLPPGMEVAHLCDNPACVKPSHLVGATRIQNERMKAGWRMGDDGRHTLLGWMRAGT